MHAGRARRETRGKLTRDVEFSTTDCASAQPNDVEPMDPPDSH
jgi:hypothetical protein